MNDPVIFGGGNQPQLPAGSTSATGPVPAKGNVSTIKKENDSYAPKRGYRACVHCRLRKARCDLGDVNAPSEPPCGRCRREQRSCVFLPSKRRRKTDSDSDRLALESILGEGVEVWTPGEGKVVVPPANAGDLIGSTQHIRSNSANNGSDWKPDGGFNQQNWTDSLSTSAFKSPDNNKLGFDDRRMPLFDSFASTRPTESFGQAFQAQASTSNLSQLPETFTNSHHEAQDTTPASLSSAITDSASAGLPSHPRKRRRTANSEPDATRRIVVASFSNETDALEILANAATDSEDRKDTDIQEEEEGEDERLKIGEGKKKVGWMDNMADHRKGLSEFALVKKGILSEELVRTLVEVFFELHHPVLPIFQTTRIPRTPAQLAQLADEDPFLLSVIIAVATHHHPDPNIFRIHDQTWAILRETLADFSCSGLPASVGFVEGVLLLAENLPREKTLPTKETSMDLLVGSSAGRADMSGLHGTENRRSWSLTGIAIRAAYGIGLDQLALETNEGERTAELERARGAWTWCYLYDRTIDKLLPFLMFAAPAYQFGRHACEPTGEAAARINFPYMMSPSDTPSQPSRDDSASLMQSLMELTQIMTNAHDILYPSKLRTSALVRGGEYYKFLDHFNRALESFKLVWKDKSWGKETLKELTWCTYHFVRLYISSFAFQAHVQRATARAEEGKEDLPRSAVSLFPRGSATSPDALYIYESIDAAHEILLICTRLGNMGVLRYLPSRYLINFAYSGTFALKAAYSGAVARKDIVKTREMVDHVCAALILACQDKDHPATRYGQMLKVLSRKLEQLSEASAVPSRFPSPEPPTPNLLPNPPLNDNFLSNWPHTNSFEDNGDFMNSLLGPQSEGQNLGGPEFDVDINFNLDGFWDDFTLGEAQGGFPFR
ncbi:hypothetical protein P7C73_g2287, partial [Tremellales sp. Uapishka_1]